MAKDLLPAAFAGEIIKAGTNGIGNTQVVVRFPNGYGASIIEGTGSYGIELGVITFSADGHWDLTYETPVTDDVLGWLDKETLAQHLREIEALPPRADGSEAS